jgi:hypothetical protein
VVTPLGFTLESFPMDFASGITIQRFTKLIGGQPLMLDVLFVAGPIDSVWVGRQSAAFEGGTIRVVSREGLIALKLAAARPQDWRTPSACGSSAVAEGGAVVDMGADAVTASLREMARCLEVSGFVAKGVDMSATAVGARLRAMGSLSDMCRRLAPVGARPTAAASRAVGRGEDDHRHRSPERPRVGCRARSAQVAPQLIAAAEPAAAIR